MAKKTEQPEVDVTSDEPEVERDQKGDLEAARLRVKLEASEARVKALEEAAIADVKGEASEFEADGKYVNARRLTHHHDIERFFRLGKLNPRDALRFQATGQLPPAPGAPVDPGK